MGAPEDARDTHILDAQRNAMSDAVAAADDDVLSIVRFAATADWAVFSFVALLALYAIVQTHRSGGTAASRNIIQETMMPKSSGSGAGDAAPQGSGGDMGQPVQEPDGAPGDLPGGSPVPAGEPSGN